MAQNNETDELPRECASALEAAFEGRHDAHVQKCARCQAVLAGATEVEAALKSELARRNEAAFTRSALSQLPVVVANPAAGASTGKGLVVVARPEPRRWAWGLAAAAAIVAVTVGVGIAGGYFQTNPPERVVSRFGPASASIQKGALTDAQGETAKRLNTGTKYTARERTVVAIQGDTLLRLEAGAAFEVGGEEENPSVRLATGDMYASSSASNSAPLRVSLKNFDTDLHSGEFFVAQEESAGTQGVVIVFSGMAQVRVNADVTLPLNAGQIYYNVEQGGASSDATIRTDQINRSNALAESGELKQLYSERVKGFESELEQIQKKLDGMAEGVAQRGELQERARRVEEYLRQHRQRLEAMSGVDYRRMPYEQIQRGLRGRIDPAAWRM